MRKGLMGIAFGAGVFVTGCQVVQKDDFSYMMEFEKTYGEKVTRYADYNGDGFILPEESQGFFNTYIDDQGWEVMKYEAEKYELQEKGTGRKVTIDEIINNLKSYIPAEEKEEEKVTPFITRDGRVLT